MINNIQTHDHVAVATKPIKNLLIVAHYTVTETKNVIFLLIEKQFKNLGLHYIFPSINSNGEETTDLFKKISLNKTGRLIPETVFKFKFQFEDKYNFYNVELHAIEEDSTEKWLKPSQELVHMSYYDIQKYNTTPLTKECAEIIFKTYLKLKPVVIKKKIEITDNTN